jgi:hypothetical protein
MILNLLIADFSIEPFIPAGVTNINIPVITSINGNFSGGQSPNFTIRVSEGNDDEVFITFSFNADIADNFKFPRLFSKPDGGFMVSGLLIYGGVQFISQLSFHRPIPEEYLQFLMN